jgi:hypothetical protein
MNEIIALKMQNSSNTIDGKQFKSSSLGQIFHKYGVLEQNDTSYSLRIPILSGIKMSSGEQPGCSYYHGFYVSKDRLEKVARSNEKEKIKTLKTDAQEKRTSYQQH